MTNSQYKHAPWRRLAGHPSVAPHAWLFRWGSAFSCILLAAAMLPALLRAQPYPDYDFQVRLDTERKLIAGIVRIRIAEDDHRPRDAWWLRLPPNRFLEEDPKGIAKPIAPFPMGIHFSKEDPIDPLFPDGFSEGSIEIVSVEDEEGRRLSFTKQADPNLRVGMWRDDALIRVAFDADSSGREIRVHFVTNFPERHVDGWNELGIVAEQWHPLLLDYRDGAWIRDAYAPAGGRYRMRLVFDRAGWLKAGPAAAREIPDNSVLTIESSGEALRVFPLIYLHLQPQMESHTEAGRFQVFYEEGNERVAELTLDVGRRFSAFVKRQFGLELPPAGLTFLQSQLPTGEITTLGNTILIPTVYFKNNVLLDRVYTGKLTRAISEIWFGEGVWSNRNTDAWLHLGLTGFLALEFFEYTYGWDAPVHELVDWLSPRYREHFFESKALQQIRSDADVPLTVPIYFYEYDERAMVAVFQKAPLVIRALKYAMGANAFDEGLQSFYETYRHRQATVRSLQEVMEQSSGQSLDWYFDAWFRGTTQLDYALGEWDTEPTAEGHKLTVNVHRLEEGVMPVVLQVALEDGSQLRHVWDGKAEQATLEFPVAAPVESITLDPQEYLLETSRLNNHSTTDIRWRPFYDWSKEREALVTVVARLGGNAIDGNTVGVGTNIKINSENNLTLIPIYGENSSEVLFEAAYSSNQLISSNSTLQLLASKIGGKRTFSTGIRIGHVSGGDTESITTYAFNFEEVEAAAVGTDADAPIQQPGTTNNISILHESVFGVGRPFSTDISIDLEHSQPALNSDFKYNSVRMNLGQQLDFHVNHALRFELIRGLIDGSAPVQKQHLLGDPLVLRGFPRTVSLVHDNIVALRLEYQFVATRRVFGETVQNRKLTLLFFGDLGKGWNNGEDFDDAITRRDVGIGFNIDLSLLNTLNFPLRVELAFPVGDPEFKDRQVILLQAISFF